LKTDICLKTVFEEIGLDVWQFHSSIAFSAWPSGHTRSVDSSPEQGPHLVSDPVSICSTWSLLAG